MTKLLDEALNSAPAYPGDGARSVSTRSAAEPEAAEPLDPAHRETVLRGLDELRRGDFASDSEVCAAFRSFER